MKWWPFGKESSNGPKPPPEADPKTLYDVLGDKYSAVEALARPRIRLVSSARAGTSPAGRTKVGGLPNLPPGLAWPTFNEEPLSFVGQIDLAPMAELAPAGALPREGLLLFFYDLALHFDAGTYHRSDSWRVVYVTESAAPRERPPAKHDMAVYPEVRLSAVADTQLPDTYSLEHLTSLHEEVVEAYGDVYYDLRKPGPAHQVFGYPEPIQGSPFDECQVEANGLFEDGGKGYADPRWQALRSGIMDWQLLFQVDSDDDAEMLWGDSGILYFCIREEDLRKADFDKVWMIFQCS